MSSCVESLRTKKVNNLCGYGGRRASSDSFCPQSHLSTSDRNWFPAWIHTHFTCLAHSNPLNLNLNQFKLRVFRLKWIKFINIMWGIDYPHGFTHTSLGKFKSSSFRVKFSIQHNHSFLTVNFQSWAVLKIITPWNLWKVDKNQLLKSLDSW